MTRQQAERFAEALADLLSDHNAMLHVEEGEICVRRLAGDAPSVVSGPEDSDAGWFICCHDWCSE